jgi:hypothetical protein
MPHDYLRDTLASRYNECKSCGNRMQFAYVRCSYCYSCHWKKEKLEKARLEPLVMSNSAFLEKYQQPKIIEQSHPQQLSHDNNRRSKQRLLMYMVNRQNQFATTIPIITCFHCMVLVIVYVGSTIHKIILQSIYIIIIINQQ